MRKSDVGDGSTVVTVQLVDVVHDAGLVSLEGQKSVNLS